MIVMSQHEIPIIFHVNIMLVWKLFFFKDYSWKNMKRYFNIVTVQRAHVFNHQDSNF